VATVPSVSRKLVLAVAVPLVLFCVLTLVVLDYLFKDISNKAQRELVEQQLVSLVSAIEANSDGSIDVRVLDPESQLLTPGSGHYANVTDRSGVALWSSPSLAGIQLDFGAPIASGERRYAVQTLADGTRLQTLSRGLQWEYVRGESREVVLNVAESSESYREQLTTFRRTMMGWFAFMTLGMLALLGWLLRLTLAPVRRLETEIGEVEAGARERLGDHYPRELSGTTATLNSLLVSERTRIARYRDSLGNLAHELKTPLAVMRAALRQESALQLETSPATAINHEIDRISTIVDRQLTRASGGGAVTIGQAPCLVATVANELRATLLKVRSAKDLHIALQLQSGAAFVGDPGDLTEMLGNLLDNACKWCQSQVRLRASIVARTAGAAVAEGIAGVVGAQLLLQVDDDGPGVAANDRTRILERGVRADERAEGHGLGLAMVSDTATLYGGELRVAAATELGGARFELLLPGRLIGARA
jgi:two-component system, OmpR family, sensor histidine kinase PhoQ